MKTLAIAIGDTDRLITLTAATLKAVSSRRPARRPAACALRFPYDRCEQSAFDPMIANPQRQPRRPLARLSANVAAPKLPLPCQATHALIRNKMSAS